MGEGGLEGLEDRGDVFGLGLDGPQQGCGVAIQHVGDEFLGVYFFLCGLGLEPAGDAWQVEGFHIDGELPVHSGGGQLHGDLGVESFLEFPGKFHAEETSCSSSGNRRFS